MSRVRELLGPSGPLAQALDGYEERPGQMEMAEAVERAFRDDCLVLCEAGTGTGKTLAYLLPALLSGKKVIVSTATRALQEQIYFKDLPLVAQAFGLVPRAALMKGLGNYVCKRRLAEFEANPESLRPGYARSLRTLKAWVEQTESGDLAELATLPEDDPLRLEVASSSETRVGPPCPHYDTCFVTRMKREAEAAQLIVVNHHLFFADIALRGPHPARVLPDYEAVVFDEAHQIEDVATDFFSLRVSNVRVARLLGDVTRLLGAAVGNEPLFAGGSGQGVVDAAHAASDAFFRELAKLARVEEGRIALERDIWVGELERAFHTLDSALEGVSGLATSQSARLASARHAGQRAAGEALSLVERRADELREALSTIVSGGRGRVVWLEILPRRISLSSTPVDLAILLRERVFERVPAVVLTSATLATSGAPKSNGSELPAAVESRISDGSKASSKASPFAYVRSRLGLSDEVGRMQEVVVSSPFDFARQALFYTPRDLPAPGSLAFYDAAAARIAELLRITEGGCFVLTTSLKSMRELHRRLLRERGRLPLMIQGEAPKAALIARFRSEQNAVLVATSGFWEGVDVPGRALRLVVLEKIPFAVPTDPVVSARSRALEEEGENAFMKLHVPMAAISLKQGFGRLIRTRRDVGIVALLDDRVHKSYGARLLTALPKARRTSELSNVASFWQEVAGEQDNLA
jgi:ATP-dependent DNA helicase DinG